MPKKARASVPENQDYTAQAWRIEADALSAYREWMDKYVDFAYGVGLLDIWCFAKYRPDWVHLDDDKGWVIDADFPIFEPVLARFERRGARIKRISPGEAEELRVKICRHPESLLPKEKEAPKAKPVEEKAVKDAKDVKPLPHEQKAKK